MSRRQGLANIKKGTSLELVELKDGCSVLDLFHIQESGTQIGLCPAASAKILASSSPDRRKLAFFCIPGCPSPRHQRRAAHLPCFFLVPWERLVRTGGLAGGRVGGAPRLQRLQG